MAYCACDEKGHGHGTICSVKVPWKDTFPMDFYDYEPINNVKGKKIGEKALDVDQNRCCPECYSKFKEDARKNLKKAKFNNLNPL